MSICEICGAKLAAGSLEGYKTHLRRFHSAKVSRATELEFLEHVRALTHEVIKPTRTTTRSKALIIHDTEKTWGAALFPSVKPWHVLEVR